jgi:DDE superfamily endonuclease
VEPAGSASDDSHPRTAVQAVWSGRRQLPHGRNRGAVPPPETAPGGRRTVAALVDKHPTGTIYVAWDNADTHADDDVEAVVRAAAVRLVLLSLPTYSPWLNPIEMLWRQFRREVTHWELFASLDALLKAAHEFFDRYNQRTERLSSIIGAHAA